MTGDLVHLLEVLLARAGDVVPPEAIDRARELLAPALDRRRFPGAALVVALVGGTGTGKSSLLNALAGEEVAGTGLRRPHTSESLAWAPEPAPPALDTLLDDLGVARRAPNRVLPGVVVLDLPDVDSVVTEHRRLVDQLLPRIDAVVWVTDPAKYADPEVHRALLRPLAPHRSRLVAVLNRIDLVDDPVPIVEDLRRLLTDDGLETVPVLATAAAPGSGPPLGVDAVAEYLGRRWDAKRAVVERIVVAATSAARVLADAAGTWQGTTGDLDRWVGPDGAPTASAEVLASGVGPVIAEALARSRTREEAAAVLWRRAELAATVAEVVVAALELVEVP